MPWIRASLDIAVLGSLTAGPRHGYGIAQVLSERGFGLLKGGSLYPVLNRLQDASCVEATWVEGRGGPGRREYALTPAGRRRLAHDLRAWRELSEALSDLSRHEQEGTAAHG